MSPTPAGGIRLTAIDPAAFRHTPWKNGGGVTTDIAESMLPGFAPGSWEGMVWRFGRTAIVTPAPFSDLSGFDRLQVLVSGSGLVLETPDGEIDVRQPFKPVRFAGETPIVSRLEAGPVEVVNLIGDRVARVDRSLMPRRRRDAFLRGRRSHLLCGRDFLRSRHRRQRLRDRERPRFARRCRRRFCGRLPEWHGDRRVDFSGRGDGCGG